MKGINLSFNGNVCHVLYMPSLYQGLVIIEIQNVYTLHSGILPQSSSQLLNSLKKKKRKDCVMYVLNYAYQVLLTLVAQDLLKKRQHE